jgi:hypothetical protein
MMEKSPTDKRIDELAGRAGRFEADVKARFDKVDARFDKVERKLERFEDRVDARFEKVVTKEEFEKANTATKERFERVEGSIAVLAHKVDTNNRTLWVGIFVAAVIKVFFS